MNDGGKHGKSDWKEGFLFLGNQPVLDFLNTRPIPVSEPVELLPDLAVLLRWFQAAELLGPREAAKLLRQWAGSRRAAQTLEAIWGLRERLRKEVVAWENGAPVHPATIDELNRLMAEHPMRTRLRTNGRTLTLERYFAPEKPEDLLAPIAHSAARLFAEVDRRRVRKCDHCILHFLDTSKKGTRRWCSMRLCGNRIKVAAYAARQRPA
jgi:predicted RNA-binding Zn ribbon-like protein